jgi:thiol:disulfide interchange protein DsbD
MNLRKNHPIIWHRIATILVFVVWLVTRANTSASAQTAFTPFGDPAKAHHTEVTLILSADTARPGETLLAGVALKMEPGWHTYWKNPGAAGMATDIKWQLPAGVTAGEIQWPLPKKFPPADLTAYGYEDVVVLLVPLTLASNLEPGMLDLKAQVSWLECKDQCIPAKALVEATLTVRDEDKASAMAPMIQSWADKVPKALRDWTASAWWEMTTNTGERKLAISLKWPLAQDKGLPIGNVDFYPDANDYFEVEGATEKETVPGADFTLRKLVKTSEPTTTTNGDWPETISGVITIERENSKEGFKVTLPVAAAEPAAAMVSSETETANTPPQPLWRMLIYAFIGGWILNIMPCVLPVIALKILGFVSEARSAPKRIRALGGIYAIGVLFSFTVLAGVVIAVKAAGHHAGWGMQFGNPVFIVCLATLITLVALNLFGVFEVNIGGNVMNAAGELASKGGAPGAFFNGVLATALATPCTAPFLGAALGFAFAQSGPVILLFFLMVGLGLAAPYLILSWNPAWLKFLPKPGAWMEEFKIAMGFPMLATVCWLVNIAFDSYGRRTLWLGLFLVAIAAAAWVFGEFFQRGRKHPNIALGVVLVLVVGSYAYALEEQLQWRKVQPASEADGTLEYIPGGIRWQAWSPKAVEDARAAGHPVLVDFTADWCLTCQVNKRTSIETPSVRAKINDLNVVALVGDYTRFPDNITMELNHFNRAGVPLVLVYPANTKERPKVLPEVLTPGIVLDALEKAAK